MERLIAGLEGRFAAASAAEDDFAAEDLAFSLSQDLHVADDLARLGGVVLIGDVRVPVEQIGEDFVTGGAWAVPLAGAILELGGGPAAAVSEVFLGRLRTMSREGSVVEVGAGPRIVTGRLVRAGPSHLVLQSLRTVAVPVPRVDYVRRVPGGSADAP